MVFKEKQLAQGWISAKVIISSSSLLQTYFYLRKELASKTELPQQEHF